MLTLRRTAARRTSAAAALATALSVFAAPLASLHHEATVRHVACIEDGELVDAAPLTPAELAAPAHHHARTVFERTDGTPGGYRHEAHCLLASWSHVRSTAAHEGALASHPAPARALSVADVPDRRPPAIALYRLAPKLSPPLA